MSKSLFLRGHAYLYLPDRHLALVDQAVLRIE